jgi:hypothetical protein
MKGASLSPCVTASLCITTIVSCPFTSGTSSVRRAGGPGDGKLANPARP